MPKYLIIDGYNAIYKIKELDARREASLELARLHFVKILEDFMSHKRIFDKIFVIFDSKEAQLGLRRGLYGSIEVVFTAIDKDADSVIVDMLRSASPSDKISVSSDDNFIRNHVKVYGGEAISISRLKEIIMLKKKSFRSKIKEKDFEAGALKGINDELRKHWRLK